MKDDQRMIKEKKMWIVGLEEWRGKERDYCVRWMEKKGMEEFGFRKSDQEDKVVLFMKEIIMWERG